MKTRQVNIIDVEDWDSLVFKTYNRPYNFQQQDGCKSRQTVYITVPDYPNDYPNDQVPEILNHPEMGVSFKSWLERNPNKPIKNQTQDYQLGMWWERNFYPDVSMVANDLHNKGLLPAGEYGIVIDW